MVKEGGDHNGLWAIIKSGLKYVYRFIWPTRWCSADGRIPQDRVHLRTHPLALLLHPKPPRVHPGRPADAADGVRADESAVRRRVVLARPLLLPRESSTLPAHFSRSYKWNDVGRATKTARRKCLRPATSSPPTASPRSSPGRTRPRRSSPAPCTVSCATPLCTSGCKPRWTGSIPPARTLSTPNTCRRCDSWMLSCA